LSRCLIIKSIPRKMTPNMSTVIGVQCHFFHILNMLMVVLRCSSITSEGQLPSPLAIIWFQCTAPQPLPDAMWETCPPACAACPGGAPTALRLAAGRSDGRPCRVGSVTRAVGMAWDTGGQGVRSRQRRANMHEPVLSVARPAYEEHHAHEDAPAMLFPSPPFQNSACASLQEKASHALQRACRKSI
jgi:hypothetical protein